MNVIWKFICSFPHLEVLDFLSVSTARAGDGLPTDGIITFPPLTHIGISGDALGDVKIAEFVRSLVHFPFVRKLKALKVDMGWLSIVGDSCFNELLELCGPTLTRLSLIMNLKRGHKSVPALVLTFTSGSFVQNPFPSQLFIASHLRR